jgi:hypothetical protein
METITPGCQGYDYMFLYDEQNSRIRIDILFCYSREGRGGPFAALKNAGTVCVSAGNEAVVTGLSGIRRGFYRIPEGLIRTAGMADTPPQPPPPEMIRDPGG